MGGGQASQLSMKTRKRILIVEDDLQARIGLQQLMRSIGYDAEGVSDWLEALYLMREELFDLAIVDIFLSRTGKNSLNGLDLIPLLRVFNPKVPVVLVTGQSDEQLRITALKRGATLYLEKPVEPGHLTSVIRRLIAESTDHETAHTDS
jgi:DNA-binding response OmpR family regulator